MTKLIIPLWTVLFLNIGSSLLCIRARVFEIIILKDSWFQAHQNRVASENKACHESLVFRTAEEEGRVLISGSWEQSSPSLIFPQGWGKL